MLREVEQLLTVEAATSLGVTEEEVKVRLHRVWLSLRDALAETVGQSAPLAFSFHAPHCNQVVATVMAATECRPCRELPRVETHHGDRGRRDSIPWSGMNDPVLKAPHRPTRPALLSRRP